MATAMMPLHKRSAPASSEEPSGKRRGPKTKDEKLKEAQKTADYWMMRPHIEFLEYRREVIVEKSNFHRKEYLKFKGILEELDADIAKYEEGSDEEEEDEEEVEVQEVPKKGSATEETTTENNETEKDTAE